ncbi:MAG: carbohydrate kinase family protein [Promethearchaeota archaeon]|nr:MAG: carbohydrate kinase family protein [Candidatus Lokiarchaeota archaeon]
MKKIDIIGLGEVVVDWVAEVPHFPKPDEKIDAISENYFSGGVTANYLVAIARLGVSCGFIGAVGNDSYGQFLIEDFMNEKVNTTLTLKKSGKKTPVNFIFVTNGEKTIIQSPHMQTTRLEISDLDETYISSSKHLHTTLIHSDISKKAIEIAKKNDLTVSIDLESQIAQRGWENLKDFLLKCDILIPNKEGAKSITNGNTPEQAAKILIKKGIPIVIITLGNKGALITTKNYQKVISTYNVEKIIDTTGAGDTFNGVFSVGYWIKGWDLEKSCRYANAAASLKIQNLGARTGMPSEKELIKFLKEQNDPLF